MDERKPLTLWLTPGEFGVFVTYVSMLCFVIPLHEPWVDEAQAWLLARDLDLCSLLFRNLRHEGHPALWYLLLWIPTHLHLNYAYFSWISGAIGSLGIYVLLRLSPFPFYLRALLPFSFYLAYEYSVVARSYTLFPLLGFLVAHIYRQTQPRPIPMAIVLALLANVSLHGTIVAVLFALLYFWKLRSGQRYETLTSREAGWAVGIFSCAVLFVLVCIWPTRGALPRVSPTLNKIIDRLSLPDSAAEEQHPAIPTASTPTPAAPPLPAAPSSTNPATASKSTVPSMSRGRFANIPTIVGFAFSDSWIVAAVFESLVLVYLVHRGQTKLAIPAVCLVLFLVFVYSAPWHLGLVWVTMLMVLWAGWDTAIPWNALDLQNAVALFLGVLCLFQLPWTFHAVRYDATNPVSPARATADYLRTLPQGARWAGFGMSVAVQPYFSHNIFFNQPQTFGILGAVPHRMTLQQAIASHPDLLVADISQAPQFSRDGYVPVRQFCGALYFPNRPIDPGCLVVLEPSQKPTDTAP